MELDRSKLRRNVLYYVELSGLTIGGVERSIGRRAGYIARWPRTESISIDDVYKIANILGVTIDTLINEDTDSKLKLQEMKMLKQKICDIKNETNRQIEDLEEQIKNIEATI